MKKGLRNLIPLLTTLPVLSPAGEIAGVRPTTVPVLNPDMEIYFGNDFLGRGGANDDFRTMQLIVAPRLNEKWALVVDHSIMTLEEPEDGLNPARLDQFSVALAYRFQEGWQVDRWRSLEGGFGTRYAGEFGGERIQNGFHKLVGDDPDRFPYVDTDDLDLTVWAQGEQYQREGRDLDLGWLGSGWNLGWKVRGATLLTTDGQWDAVASLAVAVDRRKLDLWVGLQGDIRSGYDQDRVQDAVADNEDGVSAILGLRWGPMVVETVQNFDGDAAYGRVSFIATSEPAMGPGEGPGDWAGQFSLSLPDVYANFQLRRGLPNLKSRWGLPSVILDARFGEPQYGDNVRAYRETRQVTVDLELEKGIWNDGAISAFVSAGAGWRSEQLTGDLRLKGENSETVNRGVIIADGGLRWGTSGRGENWSLGIQTGVSLWVPTRDATVDFAGNQEILQDDDWVFNLGLLARFY